MGRVGKFNHQFRLSKVIDEERRILKLIFSALLNQSRFLDFAL